NDPDGTKQDRNVRARTHAGLDGRPLGIGSGPRSALASPGRAGGLDLLSTADGDRKTGGRIVAVLPAEPGLPSRWRLPGCRAGPASAVGRLEPRGRRRHHGRNADRPLASDLGALGPVAAIPARDTGTGPHPRLHSAPWHRVDDADCLDRVRLD